MDADADFTVGMNVRRARRYQGLSLEELAARIGKSKGWLSMIENGRLPLERRTDIGALADALEVSVTDLIGRPFPVFTRSVPDAGPLREVLMENALGDPVVPASRPLQAAAADLDAVAAAWRAGDHKAQAAMLPPLLAELHSHQGGEALEMLTRACVFASDLAKELGSLDLAWIAAERARQAAAAHGGAVTAGMAAWAIALARPVAARSRGLMRAGEAADEMESAAKDDAVLASQVYGMLRLAAALGLHLSGDRDTSAAQLAEAVRVAARIGEQPARWEAFGPANAGVWGVTLAVEAGDAGTALERADQINPADLITQGRVAALHLERARAHAMLGRYEHAVTEMRAGERACALRIRCDPLARDLVATLLERARRQAGGRDLRGLASRMGVVKPA